MKPLPLLTGSVEVASVELIEPVIELEKGPMVPVTGRSHRRLKRRCRFIGTKEAGPSESGKSDPQAFSRSVAD